MSPIFGLITDPVKGPTGVSYFKSIRNSELGYDLTPFMREATELTPLNVSSSRSRLASIPRIVLMSRMP